MIETAGPEDIRSPKFLIMDNTPLSLLGAIEALDWFFEPGCDVWGSAKQHVPLRNAYAHAEAPSKDRG